jgi:hypothetical protein
MPIGILDAIYNVIAMGKFGPMDGLFPSPLQLYAKADPVGMF